MTTFDAEWLALRQTFDLAARSDEVESLFFAHLPPHQAKILDLASGAGATVIALKEKLSKSGRSNQQWVLTDFDESLLSKARTGLAGEPGVSVQTQIVNLSKDISSLPFGSVNAVTASAFFDLVSETFVCELVDILAEHQLPLLASLTYDGRTRWEPAHGFDQDVLVAFNHHQTGDKGFGPALGPKAPQVLRRELERRGYKALSAQSDWIIEAGHSEMQQAMLNGWHSVGQEVGLEAQALADWCLRRSSQIRSDSLRMKIGHIDLFAIPAAIV